MILEVDKTGVFEDFFFFSFSAIVKLSPELPKNVSSKSGIVFDNGAVITIKISVRKVYRDPLDHESMC